MAFALAQLITPQQMSTVTETYYTSAGGTRIDKISICNTANSEGKVTLYLVPTGGGPDASNALSFERAIAAGVTWNCPDLIGQVMNKGDSIQGLAAGGALTIMASGVTIS